MIPAAGMLPQLGESMGTAISNFKKSMNEGLKEEKTPQIEEKKSS